MKMNSASASTSELDGIITDGSLLSGDNTFGCNGLCVRTSKSTAFISYSCPSGQSENLDPSYVPERRENKSRYEWMHVEERKFTVLYLFKYPTWPEGRGVYLDRYDLSLSSPKTGSLIWGINSDLRIQTDILIQSEAEEDVEAQDRIEPLIPGRKSDNSQDFLTRKVFKNIKFRLPPRSRLTLGHCILYLRPLLRDPKIKPPDNDDALLYYYNCPPSFYSVVTANRMPFQWFLVAPRSPCFVPSQKFDRRKGEFEHDLTLLSPWSNSIRYHREE